MGGGWLAGVGINLVGSIMINLGTNIMKMGHNRLAAISCTSSRPRPAVYKLREWQIGVSLFSLGNVANFVSFGYAAQSLLAAIGCIQFVSNVVFAAWVLKEQVSRGVLAATACIVAGCVLLVSGGSHVSEKYTYKELVRLYGQPAYISYMAVGGVAVILAYGAYWMGQKAVISKGPDAVRAWSAALPILYSIFSALIGTQSVLFSKTLAVLLRSTVTGDNQLGKWFTWFALVAFLTSAVFWVTRLNKGLRMFPALVIVPALQICWTLFSILSGMLYFQEYHGMRAGPTAMFVVGVVVVFAGVFLLTHATQPPAAAGNSQQIKLTSLSSKAHAALAQSDEQQQPCSGDGNADPGSNGWELAAVRPVPGQGLQLPPGTLRRGAQLLHDSSHPPGDSGDLEPEEGGEDEYERALLACTSGRCGGNSSHLDGLQQQGRQWSGQLQGSSATAAVQSSCPGSPVGALQTAASAPITNHGTPRSWLAKASSFKRRMAVDFSLDEAAAAKLTLGLGDSHIPGFSLFTMPMVDIREIPHEASMWRVAQPVEGRSYGRLPETSTGGLRAQQQDLPLLTAPHDFDETACISHGGARNAGSSYTTTSFTWPPGGSDPFEQELQAPGPFTSINPLSNAIDFKAASSASRAATRTRTQESAPSPSRASSKWKILQEAIKSNVKGIGITSQEETAVVLSGNKPPGSPPATEAIDAANSSDEQRPTCSDEGGSDLTASSLMSLSQS